MRLLELRASPWHSLREIERLGINSIGDDGQPCVVKPGDLATKTRHSLGNAHRASGQWSGQAIHDEMPLFFVLSDAKATNHPRATCPGCCQSRRQVGVEHEALDELWTISA